MMIAYMYTNEVSKKMSIISDRNRIYQLKPWPAIPRTAEEGPDKIDTNLPVDRVTIHSSNNRQSTGQITSEKETAISGKVNGTTEKDGFSFWDVLDVINPLQHIPVISTIYRAITGDEIKAPARILGDGIFGGVIGAVAGVINSVVSEFSGKGIGEHVLAALHIRDHDHSMPKPETQQMAAAVQKETPQPAAVGENRIELSGIPKFFSVLRSLFVGENETIRPGNDSAVHALLNTERGDIRTGTEKNFQNETDSAISQKRSDDAFSGALNYYRYLSLPDLSTDDEKQPEKNSQIHVIC